MNIKHSFYNIVVHENNSHYVYNTMSGYLILFDEDNYEIFKNLRINDDETIKKLLEIGFIVSEDITELDVVKFKHSCAKYNSTELALTLQTTNNCNFACPYCYQVANEAKLGSENILAIQKFIENKISNGVTKISIHWFGGEPLLNSEAIFELEHYLRQIKNKSNPLNIKNSITTNGYILNKDMFIKIMNQTFIKDIQITFDGSEVIHNETRKLKDGSGTFKSLIDNLKENLLICDNDIKFSLRTNLNLRNIDVIEDYLKILKAENILNNKNVTLNFQQTHNFGVNNNKNIYFLSKKVYSKELLKVYKLLLKYNLPIPKYSPLLAMHCTFDSINTYLISPDLKVYHCSGSNNDIFTEISKIDSQGKMVKHSNYYSKYTRNIFNKEKCTVCKMLPLCYGGCSNLESINQDECIPEKYIFEEVVKLYARENSQC